MTLTPSTIAAAIARIPGAAVAIDAQDNVRLVVAASDADDRGVPIAIRAGALAGRPALIVLAHVGAAEDLSLAALTLANAKLVGASVVMARGHCMLRVAIPVAPDTLEPARLRSICRELAQRAAALRQAAHHERPASLAMYVD